MATIQSDNFTITVNRVEEQTQIGDDGKTSEVIVYKGIELLTPVSGIPTTNQYKVTLSCTGCTANLKSDNKTIYVENVTESSAKINVSINVENIKTYTKVITVEKVVKEGEIVNVKKSISIVKQTADKVTWLVKSGDSASNMELTSEAYNLISNNIYLTANHINLQGYITANKGFSIDTSGNMTANNGTFSGNINGSNITGSTITGSTFRTKDNSFCVDAYGNIWGANITASTFGNEDNTFCVDQYGNIWGANITASTFGNEDNSFKVDAYGNIWGANITASTFGTEDNSFKVDQYGNIWGANITTSSMTSNGDNGDSTYINGGYIECSGTIDRWWLGNSETAQTIKLKSENGKFRARNDAQNRSVYFSDQGLSTTADGEIGSSGIVDFHNDWYGYGTKGLAMYSNHHVGLIAYNGYINISPEWNNRGNNTFSFQIYDAETGSARDTDGLIYYGSHVNGYSTLIRVSKDANEPGIDILDANMNKNAFLQASHLLCETVNNNYFTSGTLTMNQTSQGVQGGTQTYLSGTVVSATTFYQNGSAVTGSDIILKDNIHEYKERALDIIDKTKIYSFNRISSPERDEIGFIAQQAPDELVYKRGEFTAEELEGLTAEEKTELLDRKTKECIASADGEECEAPIAMMNQNNIIGVMFKAIQELKAEIDELKNNLEG